jgi:hypothetical protein
MYAVPLYSPVPLYSLLKPMEIGGMGMAFCAVSPFLLGRLLKTPVFIGYADQADF